MRIAPVLVLALLSVVACGVACSDDADDGGAGTAAAGMTGGSAGMDTGGGAGGATGGSGGSSTGTGGMTGGSGGMTGGAGGMTGGSGGMTGGSGEPDPCEDVASPCTDEGLSCDGAELVTCEENADGCLVATSEDCTDDDNDFCDDSGSTPECAACADLDNACDDEGAACDDDTLVACAEDENGCLVETQTDCAAGDNGYCDDDATPAECVDCADVDNACATAGTSCSGDITLVTCAPNADGCLVAANTNCTTVGDNNACDSDADPDPACVEDPCRNDAGVLKDLVCVDDEASCAGDILVTCVPDIDGCPLATNTDCTTDPGHNFCDDTLPTAACANDPCIGVTNCTDEGSVCNGPDIVDCAPNLDGCLVEAVHDCTVNGTVSETCDPNQTPHVCVSCIDATRCVGESEGETHCNSNTFETCTDTDDDDCMNRVDEPCGTNFMCHATNGCVYDGGEVCVETIAPARILREPMMSYGPFTTTGAANDYSAYGACPGLLAGVPFGAAAPDLLFALDVPPHSVIDVAFDSPTGFTGTGAWMMLLSTCTATAEETCSAISDVGVDYTNTGSATTRVYIVVDADGASNVGMFGLAVSTRPLDCGDGKRDGDEECDDGNIFDEDGCADCDLEDGYACTDADPSVCTLRPTGTNVVCGNVTCDPLEGAPAESERCCTADAKCGIAYEPFFGGSCIERVEDRPTTGAAADLCPDEDLSSLIFVFVAVPLDGCCTADEVCGVSMDGAGCVERTAAWTAMEDGSASVYYNGPFLEEPCDL